MQVKKGMGKGFVQKKGEHLKEGIFYEAFVGQQERDERGLWINLKHNDGVPKLCDRVSSLSTWQKP